MEAPSAVSDTWERIEAAGGTETAASRMVYWPSWEADIMWRRLPVSADVLETGESVKYSQVDSDELTYWTIERFSNQPKDLISTTFFSFVQIHWKVYFSKFTFHWQDLSSLCCFSDWILCHHWFEGLCAQEADRDCSLMREERWGWTQI